MKKMISFSLVALIIACTGAVVTKASNNGALERIFVYIGGEGGDITDASNYVYAPAGLCKGYGTSFCGVKVPDMQGEPDLIWAMQDLILIKNGTDPISNKTGRIKFYY